MFYPVEVLFIFCLCPTSAHLSKPQVQCFIFHEAFSDPTEAKVILWNFHCILCSSWDTAFSFRAHSKWHILSALGDYLLFGSWVLFSHDSNPHSISYIYPHTLGTICIYISLCSEYHSSTNVNIHQICSFPALVTLVFNYMVEAGKKGLISQRVIWVNLISLSELCVSQHLESIFHFLYLLSLDNCLNLLLCI